MGAHETEDNGLSFSVLHNDVAKRISTAVTSTPPGRDWSSSGHNAAILKYGNDGSSGRKMVNTNNGLLASSNNNVNSKIINSNLNSNNYDTNAQLGGSNTASLMSTTASSLVPSQSSIGNNLINSPKQQQVQQPQYQKQQPIVNAGSASSGPVPSSSLSQNVSSTSSNQTAANLSQQQKVTSSSIATAATSTSSSLNRNLYLEYPPITSIEQRRKYKTEFDNEFNDYRKLHQMIESVSKRFAQLEEKLRNEEHNEEKVNVGVFFFLFLLM